MEEQKGDSEVGETGCVVRSLDACIGWAGCRNEGHGGSAVGASTALGGEWGGNSRLSCFGELQVDA